MMEPNEAGGLDICGMVIQFVFGLLLFMQTDKS